MHCPFCSFADTKVLESRLVEEAMRRRRKCLKCASRFTTYERASFNFLVSKKDGREQPFDLRKVAASIERACAKAEQEHVQLLAQKVYQKILRKKSHQVKSLEIGKFVLQVLKKYDKIAYLRFASIHKGIGDTKALERELHMLT